MKRPESEVSRCLSSILDHARDAIMIECGQRIVYANAAYASLLGYGGPLELVDLDLSHLIDEGDAARLLRYGQLRSHGEAAPESYSFRAQRRDGTTVSLDASVSASTISGTTYITTIARPVAAPATPGSGPHDELSAREREVMEGLLSGRRIKMIAFDLGVSEKTVVTHRIRMFRKLGISDTIELYQYALRHRLVQWL